MPLYGEAKREYQRKWVAQRREEFYADKFCLVCGSNENLELDHMDPKQKITHRIWSWSKTKQMEEIAKCQVLCHDCHLLKTIEQNSSIFGRKIEHGTHSCYSTGCREPECRKAHADLARSVRSTGGKW